MPPAEALAAVRQHASGGRIVITRHAYQRMRQRNVLHRDVRTALTSAQTCHPDGSKWTGTGPDDEGDMLTCVVVLEEGVLVVTVF